MDNTIINDNYYLLTHTNANYTSVNKKPSLNSNYGYNNTINIELVENHLRYQKYNYLINMENPPSIDKTLDDVAVKLTNVAESGVKVLDSFLTSLSPKVENVINTVLQDQHVNKSNTACKDNNTNMKLPYFVKDTESKMLIVCEIPRVEKSNCHIKLDTNNILNIAAKTSTHPDGSEMTQFNFIEQREYTFEIKVPKNINSKMIMAKIIDGVLYIDISKRLINIEEINIL